MSRIEELVEELCPDGVEYRKLGDCCKIETGRLNANAAVEDGEYPFFTTAQEVSHIDSYRWDTEALMIAGNANVGDVKYYKGKFEAYQRTYVLTNFTKELLPKFLFYVLKSQLKPYLEDHKHEAAMTYIVLSSLQNFEIPVPPLQVQEEIARTLDVFTKLATELTAELTMRTKQYAYYRDKLLELEGIEGVEYRKIGDIAEVGTGSSNGKDALEDGKYPFFIRSKMVKRKDDYEYDEEAIIIPGEGGVGDIYHYINGKYALHQRVYRIHFTDKDVDTKFAYYYFNSAFKNFIDHKAVNGTVKSIRKPMIQDFVIPVPPLSVQQDIVTKLDAFSSYCTDLTSGLPAEIEARNKQYAYYRDMMLDFPHMQS